MSGKAQKALCMFLSILIITSILCGCGTKNENAISTADSVISYKPDTTVDSFETLSDPRLPGYMESVVYSEILNNSHELTGICDFPRLNVVAVTMEQRQLNPHVPQNCYVIEQANVDGIAIWQSSDGLVFQSCPNTPLLQIADALSDYIQKT